MSKIIGHNMPFGTAGRASDGAGLSMLSHVYVSVKGRVTGPTPDSNCTKFADPFDATLGLGLPGGVLKE
ncbi:MAG: hypothetical protein IT427_09895 [Pirellulales bacterium]|nr:hypothetical protein [Pirellulales bacterium]